jgi:hypothetical protein
MKARHEEMMAQIGSLASKFDSYQAKIKVSVKDWNILMDVSLENTQTWVETGQELRKPKLSLS